MDAIVCVGPLLVDRCRQMDTGAVHESPGGNGLIFACVAARLGLEVHLFGQLGSDGRAAELRAFLARQGVETGALHALPGPTKVADIDVDAQGQWNLTRAEPHRFPYLSPEILPALPGRFGHLHVAGANSLWRAAPEATRQLMQAAAQAGMGLSVGCNRVGSELPALLDQIGPETWLFCNQEEAAAIGPRPQLCRQLVSLGARGAQLSGFGPAPLEQPARLVRVLSTVGAGDILSAVFLAAVLRGQAAEAALQSAVEWATRSVERPTWSGILPELGVCRRTRETECCAGGSMPRRTTQVARMAVEEDNEGSGPPP